MSNRDAFQPCSRVSSGKKNNTYLNMQWCKTAARNLLLSFVSKFLVAVLYHCMFKYVLFAVADLEGGNGGMHPPHQPTPNDFGRKISLNFGDDLFFFLETTWFWAEKTFDIPKSQSQFRWWPFFFFLETTWFWAEKTFDIPKSQSQFRWWPFFFFLETTWFWAEKTFDIPKNQSQFRWRHPNFWRLVFRIFITPPTKIFWIRHWLFVLPDETLELGRNASRLLIRTVYYNNKLYRWLTYASKC